MALAVLLLRGQRQSLVRVAGAGGEPRTQAVCLASSHCCSYTGWPGTEVGVAYRLCVAGDGYIRTEAVSRLAAGKGMWV